MFGPMMGAAGAIGKAMTGMGGPKPASGGNLQDVLMQRMGSKMPGNTGFAGGMGLPNSGVPGAPPQGPGNTGIAGGMPGASPVPGLGKGLGAAPGQQKRMPNMGAAMGGAISGMARGSGGPPPMSGGMSGIGALLARMGMGGQRGPMMPPPNMPNRVPPAWQRWQTGQEMINGYQNGWNPNPVLTGLMR